MPELMGGLFLKVGKSRDLVRVDGNNAHSVHTLAHRALFAVHRHINYQYIIILRYFKHMFQLYVPPPGCTFCMFQLFFRVLFFAAAKLKVELCQSLDIVKNLIIYLGIAEKRKLKAAVGYRCGAVARQ